MKRTFKATLATGAVAIAATTGLALAPAASAAPTHATRHATSTAQSPTAAAEPCGWYTTALGGAYYNHCGTGNVVIYVDRLNIGGYKDYEQCVGPGITYLGNWPDWQGAWYTGKTC